MKTYAISLPTFRAEIVAANRKEALEQFWYEYDHAEIGLWEEPIIKELTKSK